MSQHFTHRNSLNALLCVIVATPACAIGYVVCNNCKVLSNLYLCDLAVNSPILFVNAVFFLNVCVLFWVISLIVNSTWLIDPYWTIIPPLIGLFYHFHPLSATFRGQESLRAGVALTLTFLWSIRLTHSYFRRENYQFGVREDWRFADMKKASPKSWWWTSFFTAFLSQQPMLVGVTLPLWAVNLSPSSHRSVGLVDFIATAGCILGISIASVADNQLQSFMINNEKRVCEGLPKIKILRTGLWKYSRHPNYFGEQLWWWSLALFGLAVNEPWVFIGTLFNTCIMIQVTKLTEARMMRNADRMNEFLQYKKSTNAWIPWGFHRKSTD